MRHARLGVAKIINEFFELYIIQLKSYQVAFSTGTLIFFLQISLFSRTKNTKWILKTKSILTYFLWVVQISNYKKNPAFTVGLISRVSFGSFWGCYFENALIVFYIAKREDPTHLCAHRNSDWSQMLIHIWNGGILTVRNSCKRTLFSRKQTFSQGCQPIYYLCNRGGDTMLN